MYQAPPPWDEAGLQRMVQNKVEESLVLDYKDSKALAQSDHERREIAKDVSAFANSAGGTIIYGISEAGHLPIAIDAGADPAVHSREWPENVIDSRIGPRIDGLQIIPVPLEQTSPGRVAYVVIIPPSERAPHMASDNRYYKRYNFKSAPMEYYEVDDVRSRASRPRLSLQLDVRDLRYDHNTHLIEMVAWPRVVNPSRATASFVVLTLAMANDGTASFLSNAEWEWLEPAGPWRMARTVIASGSSRRWCPLTPGLTLAMQALPMRIPAAEFELRDGVLVGVARLDHDGGSDVATVAIGRGQKKSQAARDSTRSWDTGRPGRQWAAAARADAAASGGLVSRRSLLHRGSRHRVGLRGRLRFPAPSPLYPRSGPPALRAA
jgi:hypothetical protein